MFLKLFHFLLFYFIALLFKTFSLPIKRNVERFYICDYTGSMQSVALQPQFLNLFTQSVDESVARPLPPHRTAQI
jgi:hypothetical protein